MKNALLLGLILFAACGSTAGDATTTTIPGVSVSGYAHAGPVCPVESVPPDPDCADRPVGDALILVRDASGNDVAETRTDADGTFTLTLPPGTYTFVPQAVAGLLGIAAEVVVTVGTGPVTDLDFAYDTGIR